MSLTEHRITDGDLAALLLAVGAEPPVGPGVFADSFQALDIDSLARTQIATLVAERWGVDVESRLGSGTTPEELRRLIDEDTAGRNAGDTAGSDAVDTAAASAEGIAVR